MERGCKDTVLLTIFDTCGLRSNRGVTSVAFALSESSVLTPRQGGCANARGLLLSLIGSVKYLLLVKAYENSI